MILLANYLMKFSLTSLSVTQKHYSSLVEAKKLFRLFLLLSQITSWVLHELQILGAVIQSIIILSLVLEPKWKSFTD